MMLVINIVLICVVLFFAVVFSERKQKKVVSKAADVAEQLNRKLDEIQESTDNTHSLVNSNMAIQLNINYVLATRLAKITNDPKDIEVAEQALIARDDHMRKQAIVDENIKSRARKKGGGK